MIAAGMIIGAGVGLGLLLIAYGLVPRRPPLAQALADLLDPAPTGSLSGRETVADRSRSLLADRLSRLLAAVGVDLGRLDADLRVTGRTIEQHLFEKATAALAGVLLPPATVLMMRLGGAAVPLSAATVGAVLLGAGGFVLPDVLLRQQAGERRRDFRFALSAYLDLNHILLAAGAGVESAVDKAASAGEGWAFDEIRRALARGRLPGSSPWAAFSRLGEQLDLPELRQLAESLLLAGTQGAKVRTSLEARAASLRARDLSEMEADADAATERMAVPTVLMVVGFVIFVGYPALTQILGF